MLDGDGKCFQFKSFRMGASARAGAVRGGRGALRRGETGGRKAVRRGGRGARRRGETGGRKAVRRGGRGARRRGETGGRKAVRRTCRAARSCDCATRDVRPRGRRRAGDTWSAAPALVYARTGAALCRRIVSRR